MKTLCLLRHAKSDWDAVYNADHERPLNARGKRAAQDMGLYLKQAVTQPDLVLSSSAARTKETLVLLLKYSGWTPVVTYHSELYLCSRADIINQLSSVGEHIQSVLLVGHQPTTGDFASWLLGGQYVEVPTGTFMKFSLPTSTWSNLKPGEAQMDFHITPRQLETR